MTQTNLTGRDFPTEADLSARPSIPQIQSLQNLINIIRENEADSRNAPVSPVTIQLRKNGSETISALILDGKYQERTHELLGIALKIIQDHPEAKAAFEKGDPLITPSGKLIAIYDELIDKLVAAAPLVATPSRIKMIAECDLKGLAKLDIAQLLQTNTLQIRPDIVEALVNQNVTGQNVMLDRYKATATQIRDIVKAEIDRIDGGSFGARQFNNPQADIQRVLAQAGLATNSAFNPITFAEPLGKALKDYETAISTIRGGNVSAETLAASVTAVGALESELKATPVKLVDALNSMVAGSRGNETTQQQGLTIDKKLMEPCRPVDGLGPNASMAKLTASALR